MSEANQLKNTAFDKAFAALAEGQLNDIVNRLHGSHLAKALAEGGYEIVITAKRYDGGRASVPYIPNAVMVPTRERADDKAETLRLQNELSARGAKLEQQLCHALEERDNARGELAARATMVTDVVLTSSTCNEIANASVKAAAARRLLSRALIHLEDVLRESGISVGQHKPSKISEAEKALDSFPEPPISADWAGRTRVIREPSLDSDKDPSGGPVRFVEITSIDGPSASGHWKHGDEHTFCRYTGRCLESSNGAMAGWMIAPHEMHRHRTKPDAAGEGVSS